MRIEKDELLLYFEASMDMSAYLNRKTGEIIFSDEYDKLTSTDDDDFSVFEDYIQIPSQNSRAGYDDMVDFSHTVKQRLRDLLEVALDGGSGVFSRFKNVLKRQDDDSYDKWLAFSEKRKLKRMIEWLKSNDIEPEFI